MIKPIWAILVIQKRNWRPGSGIRKEIGEIAILKRNLFWFGGTTFGKNTIWPWGVNKVEKKYRKKKNRLRRKYRKKASTSLTKQKKSTRELKLDT